MSEFGANLKHPRLTASIAGIASALYLTGCVTRGQGGDSSQPVVQPTRVAAIVSAPPPPHVVAQPVVVEEVMPDPNDEYVTAASDNDVVFIGGSTYIWVTGPDGQRHRHFYGNGDRRREVLLRRDNLRSVVTHLSRQPSMSHVSRIGVKAPGMIAVMAPVGSGVKRGFERPQESVFLLDFATAISPFSGIGFGLRKLSPSMTMR